MVVRHVTPCDNMPGIRARGLDPQCSRGRQLVVWLHRPSRTPWAILHALQRHRVPLARLRVLTCVVPRTWLRRAHTGIWVCDRRIPWERIRSVEGAARFVDRLH